MDGRRYPEAQQVTAARPDTWMPMFWGDYLRDTGHLSTQEHGAYLLLIGHYWTTGKPLPDNDVQLARIARLSSAVWGRMRAVIAAFFTISDGLWMHGRIEIELANAAKFLDKQAENGRKGGRPKKPTGNPEHNPEITTSPSPSPSPSPEESPAQPSSLDAARAASVKQKVSEILNSPTVTMFNRVDAWLASGADPERDIYPTIAAGLKKVGTVRSLSYFDGMIADAIAARTRPLPAGSAPRAASPKRERGEYTPAAPASEAVERRRLENYASYIKRGQNPGMDCTQIDIRKMLRLGLVNESELAQMGLAA